MDSFNIPHHTMDELYARFIGNLPKSTLATFQQDYIRVFFEIELAHWFYLDYYWKQQSDLPSVDMLDFAAQFFARYPQIVPAGIDWRAEYDRWLHYKATTATAGAIILDANNEMVLLVQGFHTNRWTFPGGKPNEGETFEECAIREVIEETGLDISALLRKEIYLEHVFHEVPRRHYIIERMPRITALKPQTKNEIEAITWFSIEDLPRDKHDSTPMEKLNLKAADFFLIIPFIKNLKIYLDYRKRGLPPLDALEEFKLQLSSVSVMPVGMSGGSSKGRTTPRRHPPLTDSSVVTASQSSRPVRHIQPVSIESTPDPPNLFSSLLQSLQATPIAAAGDQGRIRDSLTPTKPQRRGGGTRGARRDRAGIARELDNSSPGKELLAAIRGNSTKKSSSPHPSSAKFSLFQVKHSLTDPSAPGDLISPLWANFRLDREALVDILAGDGTSRPASGLPSQNRRLLAEYSNS